MPRISAAIAALVKAENSISYCETKSLNMTKISRSAMKKKSTTGAISRIRPRSISALDGLRTRSKAVHEKYDSITKNYRSLGVAESLAISSARIGTPILHAWTPCTTHNFSTSMISSIVAPSFSAALI